MKKSYDSKFKSKVTLEAIKGERMFAEIASEFGIHSRNGNIVEEEGSRKHAFSLFNKSRETKRTQVNHCNFYKSNTLYLYPQCLQLVLLPLLLDL